MNGKTAIMVLTLVLACLLLNAPPACSMPDIPQGQGGPHNCRDLGLYYDIQAIVSSVNIALSILLLGVYLDTYRRMRSEFSLALVVFSLVLLSYSLTSNPFVRDLFGFRGSGLGPFGMLPDVFACMGLIILVYLSLKY